MTSDEDGSRRSLVLFHMRPAGIWGGRFDVLINGMLHHEETSSRLERVGPFVPPVSFPTSSIVVTDSFRRLLESADTSARLNSGLSSRNILWRCPGSSGIRNARRDTPGSAPERLWRLSDGTAA